MGWIDWRMSSVSNSWINEAWMAAPRAAREEGERETGLVEGERMLVVGRNKEVRRAAILGV